MEAAAGQGMSIGGVTVVGPDAASDYHVAPRTAVIGLPLPELGLSSPATVKKKRGRSRKYGPDGTPTPLSPKPISSSAPPPPHSSLIDFSAGKRGQIRPLGSVTKAVKMRCETDAGSFGEWGSCSVSANFTPQMILVNIGEDVTMKIISFARQQGPRAICILSANGLISSVTFRQPESCGGTLTYEGRFEILSLAGSFVPSDIWGTRSRAGGISVSLACPDGCVVGGAVAGLLIAASPVQIVVGSFLTGNKQETQRTAKQIPELNATTVAPTAAVPISTFSKDETYEETQEQPHQVSTNQVLTSSSPFRCDNTWPSVPADMRNKPTDINLQLHG